MSDFVKTRFFFIMLMISLSIAQGLVVHASQKTSCKFERALPNIISLDMWASHP